MREGRELTDTVQDLLHSLAGGKGFLVADNLRHFGDDVHLHRNNPDPGSTTL